MFWLRLIPLFFLTATCTLEAVIYRQLLITGCGRSGTTYTSKILEKSGIDMPHENVGAYGAVSWFSTYRGLSLTHHLSPDLRFLHTFHQVRNPLHTISSVYYSFDPVSWGFIQRNISQILPSDSLLEKSAKYWYYWNLKAESISEWTYRLEDIEHIWPEFCRRAGVPYKPHVFNEVPRDTNTWNLVQHRFTWKELREQLDDELFDDIQSLARKYGYSITD
jgi:hypothetical protein